MEGDVKRAFNKACKLLAIRDRSVHEIRSALEKKDFAQNVIETTLDELADRKLVDDKKFAARYAEFLVRNKKAGPRYVAAALVRKGLEKTTAETAANDACADPRSQDAAVREWIEKKGAVKKKKDTPEKLKKRIYDFLLRRGFSPDVVLRNIRNLRG